MSGYAREEINFETLDYGAYWLDIEDGIAITENVKYATAEFNRLHVRRVRLPDGKGNVIYLLTDSFDGALKMVTNKTFLIPPLYKRFYYPQLCYGMFMKRRYRLNLNKEKVERFQKIKTSTRFIPYPTRRLQRSIENVFFATGDLFEIVKPIIERYPIKRNYEEFWKEFCSVLQDMTPPPLLDKEEEEKGTVKNPNMHNRIMIIDADSFGFKMGAPLNDNKTNPLFLLFLAYFRMKDLRKIDVDMDMLICSRNLFIKFNPARAMNWQKFRIALFKIMKANLDTYTDQLTDEEKAEITDTAVDHFTHNIVDDAVKPFTKNVSPGVKETLVAAVDSKIRNTVLTTQAQMQVVQHDVDEVSQTIGPNRIVKPSSASQKKPDLFQSTMKVGTAAIPNVSDKGKSIIKTNPYKPISRERQKLFDAIIKDYRPLSYRTDVDIPDAEEIDLITKYEDEIRDDVNEILVNDEEVMAEVNDEIQDKIVPMRDVKTAPVNSARDMKLREAQRKIVVKDATIEEILERDAMNVPIKTENKSSVLKTSNQNMHNISFANFDKTYLDELYMRDLVAAFDMLKDKASPFYITGIDVTDTSTTMDLKETWKVHLVDENKKKHTITVDIPKFYQNRFMLIGGNKYIILKQNFYNPLVKDSPNTVILTTNFNKVTIQRKATKSLATVERIFSLIRKTGDTQVFIAGDSTKNNLKYASSLEYDELARRLFKFESGSCQLFFSREYMKEWMQSPEGAPYQKQRIGGDEFPLGIENGKLILINEETGKDHLGRMIADIIEENLSDDYKAVYRSIKGPKQSMYAEGKLAGQFLPIAATLIVWIGISKMLDKMGMKWEFYPDLKRVPKDDNMSHIRFADGVLAYEPLTYAELILNGLSKMNPERLTFESLNSEEGYTDYIYSIWGNYTGILELQHFYEFLLDGTTKDVCRDLDLPTEASTLLIYAVKLLCDNAFVSKASDKSYRVRSIEIIPEILYSCLAAQYKSYVKTGRRTPMTLKQRAVIDRLMAEKMVDEYSTLNPAIEVGKAHTISTKGYRGSNSEHSYDEEKRSYDPSAVGKIAMSTSADANVGINRELVIEPTLTNARGYRDPVEDPETLRDVNIFSPVEMLTPGTARNEDPIRTAIANKQSQHLVPVAQAEPTLVSNGFDEALQFHLSNDFVINAEEDGEVIEVNEEIGFIMVRYKSGKNFAINIKPEVVKNSGGGFYISNQLKPTVARVGQKFKKDEPLAYHDKYFKHSKLNGLRYAIGPLVKMCFMSSYNTYEDAGICTESLAEKMKTSIVYPEVATFKRNSNILHIVNIGDKVNIGDSLIRYDTSFEDNEIAKYLTKLSEENKAILEEETRNDIKANHAGKVVDIKIYTLHDPSNLSPSLGRVVSQYFQKGLDKKAFLEKYDSSPGIIKAGYMLTDSTEPLVTRYDNIKKYKGIDVLIEIFIEHADVMGVGDKIALYSANKQIISEVIPRGYEPYSEFRPEEEISVMTSPGTIARRMTPAVIPISTATKCLLELKRKIGKEIRYN